MAEFDIIRAWPTAAVKAGGTITFPYPAGRSAVDYWATGAQLYVKSSQNLRDQAQGHFSIAYGGSNITVTYTSGPTIPVNTEVVLQAPLVGVREVRPVAMTQAAYDALATKDPGTLYATVS